MIKTTLTLLFIIAQAVYAMDELAEVQMNNYRMPLSRPKARYSIESGLLSLLAGIVVLVTVINTTAGSTLTVVLLVAVVTYFAISYSKRRTKLKLTPRGLRLLFALLGVLAAVNTLYCAFINVVFIFYAAGFLTLIVARGFGVFVSFVLRPLENLNNYRYIKAAAEKLKDLNAVKIGITGSFGKTSCKNILSAMLGKKYRVLMSAGNYNTPMGICLAVKELKGDEEVFIAEMGARRKGDIKELVGIVKPTYAIVTGVGNQHLASFKTEDAIYKTKKELVDLLPMQGAAVFNGDNAKSRAMARDCRAQTLMVYLENKSGIHAENIRLTNAGSSFDIVGLGETFSVSTRLLGRHNILNILMCAALAHKLEVPKYLIASAIEELQPIPHRLQLIENARAITIIDDSYNANIDGAAFALEVLRQFDGRKVVFTQGIVELGKKQEEVNIELGKIIASVADQVILTGENTGFIKKGLNRADFSGEILTYKSLADAEGAFPEILRSGDILLIQNDIP
ncbi:MAG: UDP-N-acetylmuramoyl-tripeptide--D-alanyl-D-alanine ligase [Clostridia bacterium]